MSHIKIKRWDGFTCNFSVEYKGAGERRYLYVDTPQECAEEMAELWIHYKYGYREHAGRGYFQRYRKLKAYRKKLAKRLVRYIMYDW